MKCRSCGSEVTQVRGVTGRVITCGQCGWGRVELTGKPRWLAAAAETELVETGLKLWRAASISC